MIQGLNRIANRARDVLFVPGTEKLWRRRLLGKAIALVYHRVTTQDDALFLAEGGTPTTTIQELEQDLRLLEDLGAQFLTFEDLRKGIFPDANHFAVLLTFDDGFADTYRNGVALANSRGARATVFQCSAMIDSTVLLHEHYIYWISADSKSWAVLSSLAVKLGWTRPENLAASQREAEVARWLCTVPFEELEQATNLLQQSFPLPSGIAGRLYPSADEIRLARQKRNEIGSHGHRHLHRDTISDPVFESELMESKRRLGAALGHAPESFSFPFNARKSGDHEICAQYFSQVATVDLRPISPDCDPLSIPRFAWPGPAKNALRRRRWLLTGQL